jgi:hypothetical protein
MDFSDQSFISLLSSLSLAPSTKSKYLFNLDRLTTKIFPFAFAISNISPSPSQVFVPEFCKFSEQVLANTTIHYIIQNPDLFFPAITSYNFSLSSPFNLRSLKEECYVPISSILKHHPSYASTFPKIYQCWGEIKKQLKDEVNKSLNIPTENQLKGYIHWDNIIKIRDVLPNDHTLRKLLLAFYTYIPPKRADYGSVKLYANELAYNLTGKEMSGKETAGDLTNSTCDVSSQMQANHLILPTSTLILQKYKTSKVYHTKTIILPLPLMSLLRESLSLFPRAYLFVKSDSSPFTSQSSFKDWADYNIKIIFNNPHTSINTFRHSYITDNHVTSLPLEKRVDEADAMDHNIRTQSWYVIATAFGKGGGEIKDLKNNNEKLETLTNENLIQKISPINLSANEISTFVEVSQETSTKTHIKNFLKHILDAKKINDIFISLDIPIEIDKTIFYNTFLDFSKIKTSASYFYKELNKIISIKTIHHKIDGKEKKFITFDLTNFQNKSRLWEGDGETKNI